MKTFELFVSNVLLANQFSMTFKNMSFEIRQSCILITDLQLINFVMLGC